MLYIKILLGIVISSLLTICILEVMKGDTSFPAILALTMFIVLFGMIIIMIRDELE